MIDTESRIKGKHPIPHFKKDLKEKENFIYNPGKEGAQTNHHLPYAHWTEVDK